MKKVLLLILALLMLCACGVQEEHQEEITIDKELISENPIVDDSAEQKQEDNKQENDTQQTYEKTVVAHTNFELENGGFEPEFIVTLSEDLILEGEGDNLSVIFPDENSLLLGWCFIYEIREYDKYDNPLYYYDNPEESLGYISASADRSDRRAFRQRDLAPTDQSKRNKGTLCSCIPFRIFPEARADAFLCSTTAPAGRF